MVHLGCNFCELDPIFDHFALNSDGNCNQKRIPIQKKAPRELPRPFQIVIFLIFSTSMPNFLQFSTPPDHNFAQISQHSLTTCIVLKSQGVFPLQSPLIVRGIPPPLQDDWYLEPPLHWERSLEAKSTIFWILTSLSNKTPIFVISKGRI